MPQTPQIGPPSEAAQSIIQTIGDFAAVLGVVGAMLLGGAGWFWQFWRKIKPIRDEFRAKQTVRLSLQCSSRTATLLQEWAKKNGAMRALLLVAENCKFEQPAQPYRISVAIDAASSGIPSVMDRWDNWPADGWYRTLLERVFAAYENGQGAVLLVTQEMDQDKPNVLRDYYMETGVVASVVFFFKLTRRFEFLYVSLNFGEPRPTTKDSDGAIKMLPHSEETVEKHLSRAKELIASPEKVREKVRRLQIVWAEY